VGESGGLCLINMRGVAKGIKKELNTLDEANFVRDVENRDSHYLSQSETIWGL
jgi:hypothetical protein